MSISEDDALEEEFKADDEELEGFGLTDEEDTTGASGDEDSSSFNYNEEE